ncbi:hypothetical protein AGMMS49975_27650 [Clostridia bacterium]|nr:hypothetical protein AGMMS49975_27650 [Clostridia bacterium]
MNRHLVAVEIGVVRRTHERVEFESLALDKNRLKRLYSQTVEGRGAAQKYSYILESTVGRIIFNEAVPQDIGFVERVQDGLPFAKSKTIQSLFSYEINFITDKKKLSDIVKKCIDKHGSTNTSEVLDKIKALGFKYSTQGSLTVSAADMIIPEKKQEILDEGDESVDKIYTLYRRGLITEEERHKKVLNVWKTTIDTLAKEVVNSLDPYNNIRMMAISGARGSINQISQLIGMRGLMASPSGDTIEVPVKSNFRTGLTVLEYYSSAHGARKGLTDTALKTADSGYLTRRLVDVSQDIIIREDDCFHIGRENEREPIGVWVAAFQDVKTANLRCESDEELENNLNSLNALISAEDILNPAGGFVIRMGETFNDKHIKELKKPFYKSLEKILTRTEMIEPLSERIRGRWSIVDVKDPETGEIIVPADTIIGSVEAEKIEKR